MGDLVVFGTTDLRAGDAPLGEFDQVHVRIARGSETIDDVMLDASSLTFAARAPTRLRLVRGLAPGEVLVEVSLVAHAVVVITRRVRVHVDGDYTLTLAFQRQCLMRDCGAEHTCVGGACVAPTCLPSQLLDGCDGFVAQCATCDDAVDCTLARCDHGVCELSANDARCPVGEYCDVTLGCLAAPACTAADLFEDRDGDGLGGAAIRRCPGPGLVTTSGDCDDEDPRVTRCAMDGGTPDVGPADAGRVDAALACGSDAECDDHVACTTDRCVTGSCRWTPDDTRCTGGTTARCDPADPAADAASGCVTCDATSCAPSGCETATCAARGVCMRASTCASGQSCCLGTCSTSACCTPGMPCRASAGACDVAETCRADGTCPPDALASAGFECRASRGECDVAEQCNGTAATCPTDGFQPFAHACATGTCDGVGACTSGCTPGASCSTGNPCANGTVSCPGGTPTCMDTSAAPAATVCRPAVSVCDVAETCGGAMTCPADGFASSSTPCRASADACDVVELCTGTSATCPSDGVAPNGTSCRSTSGPCDVAETCDGVSPACPSNGFASASTGCRSASLPCDQAESCTGVGPSCPPDGFLPASTPCRSSAGACDVAETCDGASPTCPSDALAGSGTVCRAGMTCEQAASCDGASTSCPANAPQPDGTPCTGGTCAGGSCCTGCRSGATCMAGTAMGACGAAGSACAVCGECQACSGGSCMPAAEGASCMAGAGSCHGGTCCTGCTVGASCLPGTSSGACGFGGEACTGACGTCDPGPTGGTCRATSDSCASPFMFVSGTWTVPIDTCALTDHVDVHGTCGLAGTGAPDFLLELMAGASSTSTVTVSPGFVVQPLTAACAPTSPTCSGTSSTQNVADAWYAIERQGGGCGRVTVTAVVGL